MNRQDLLENYRNSDTILSKDISILNKRSDRFSNIRLIFFAASVALSIAVFYIFNPFAALIFFLLMLTILGVIIHFHNKLIFEIRKKDLARKIIAEQSARINLDWDKIPKPSFTSEPHDLTTERDLDLTGEFSLHHLLDITFTKEGSRELVENITREKPNIEKINRNRKVISELSAKKNFIEGYLLKKKLISKSSIDTDKIFKWFFQSEHTEFRSAHLWIASVLIFTYGVLFALNLTIFPNSFWIIILLVYLFYYFRTSGNFRDIIEEAEMIEADLSSAGKMYRFIEENAQEDLINFREQFKEFFSEHSPLRAIRDLEKYILMLGYVSNPVLKILVNLVFPYDFLLIKKITDIRNEIAGNVKQWLKKLHEFESVISLSNFAMLNPGYSYAEFAEDKSSFEAKKIGHPLIPFQRRVANDFSFEKENEIVIITGSNMSGKSTFLKTIGINICLINSGAPSCAEEIKISPLRIFTCIKVDDSVTDGISYFYAEVKRLKQLLEMSGNDNQVLFLIDEIFKGTNNKERLEGSRAFINELARRSLTGFVSTHDLDLVNLKDNIGSISNYHFKEEIENDKMKFDYKIHKGPCPTTNALRIMELEGLPVELKKPST